MMPIKLVAKKKMKTLKEPNKKSVKKLKIKSIQDQPKAKDIQDDQISSAHVKLKTEPQEDKHGTEDKGGGTLPARRRGRSASKTEPSSQTSAKVAVDDQRSKEIKSADRFDPVKESGAVESKTKKLKHKETVTEQSSEVNQLVIRRSNRVTNPLSKKVSDSAAEPESPSKEPESLVKNAAVQVQSKPDVSKTVEAKPSARSDRRRQSKRLSKDVTMPENHAPLPIETNLAVQCSDSLPFKNEEMRVPSLKLKKIRNPKYDLQASEKNSARKKKKLKKFIWALTLEAGGIQTQDAENTVKELDKTVSEVDQVSFCDSSISKSMKVFDKKSKLDDFAQQESENMDNSEKSSQKKADISSEEKSALQVEVEVEHVNETSPQEMTKTDSGKVVPPLQIKKVSSPTKHKSSKPSFLIQQVSPGPEKKEDVLKDGNEENEDNSTCLDAEVTPTRRLRRRTSSFDLAQTKSVSHKPMTSQKRKLRKSPQDGDTPQAHVDDSSQAIIEDSSSNGLPKNSCQVLAKDSSKVACINPSEAPDKDPSKIAGDP